MLHCYIHCLSGYTKFSWSPVNHPFQTYLNHEGSNCFYNLCVQSKYIPYRTMSRELLSETRRYVAACSVLHASEGSAQRCARVVTGHFSSNTQNRDSQTRELGGPALFFRFLSIL